MITLPCAIVRGGTSKGVFLLDEHLPQDLGQRTRLLLGLMGSPDPRQIDGLGGADPLTSKVAIVSRSSRPGIDVEYESVEVGIAEATVNLGVMCGNLLAGVGAFAIAEGLIAPRSPVTTVRIYCRSNQKTVIARFPCARGSHGAEAPSLLEMEDSTVNMVFKKPGGAVTGKLLPTREPVTTLTLAQGKRLDVSIVDAGTLYAFASAEAFGLTGAEDAATLDGKAEFRAAIEAAREIIADRINLQRFRNVPLISPRLIKIAIVAALGRDRDDADIVARIINRAKVHKAYAVSGAICLAAAAVVPGTLVNDIVKPAAAPLRLRIGHPAGILSLMLRWSAGSSGPVIHAAEIQRSARIIMRGNAHVDSAALAADTALLADDVQASASSDTHGKAIAS